MAFDVDFNGKKNLRFIFGLLTAPKLEKQGEGNFCTTLWNIQITLDGLAKDENTNFLNLWQKLMKPGRKILKSNA